MLIAATALRLRGRLLVGSSAVGMVGLAGCSSSGAVVHTDDYLEGVELPGQSEW